VYLKSSTYAFSLVLSVYLLGIAAGSSLASWFAGNSKRPLYGLAALQVAVALSVVAGMIAFPTLSQLAMNLIGSTRIDSFARSVAFMFAQAGIVLLLPTIFMGAMFPYGVAAYHRSSRGVSESVGSLYAANTLGNIAGSIVVGFFAISLIGVRHSMIALVAVNLFAAAALVARQTRPMVARALAPAAALVIALAAHSLVSPRLFYNSITTPWNSILYYREGASDTVAVIERGKEKDRALIYSDGRGAAGTSTVHWNLYFGHLPMLLHPNPQEVLHICYGSGNSVLAVTRHDPERVDVVELSPHVREASQYFWTNEGVIDDPRVHLIIEDGRNFLLGTDRTYDVISLEPPNIFTAGVVNLYSKEFYDLARNRLKPGGIMMQWLPTPESSTEDRGRLIRAFTDAFPHVTVWQQLFSTSLLLAGTLEPLSIDVAAIERRMQTDAMKKDIETMRVENVLGFLSFFLLGDDSVRRLVAPHEPVRDDRTVVDFSMPRFIGSGYGLSLYTYAIGDERASPWKVINDRLKEYATWGDSASLIIADPEQARRVDRAIRLRMSGKPGQLAAEAAPADGSAPTGNSPTSPQ
jgi:spermidine synthase